MPLIEARIRRVLQVRPRHWQKKLNKLETAKRTLLSNAKSSANVKGWRGFKARVDRFNRFKLLSKKHTLAEIGAMEGISRARVHQILKNYPERPNCGGII